eukprot:s40_g17.t1
MMLRPSLQVMKILLCRMRQRSFCKFFRLCYTRTCKPPASISEISSEFQIHMLPSLRRGLRPCRARFAGYQPRRAGPPTVYHEAYSPEWPATHRFPMWKFKDLAELLVEEGLVESFSDFVTPEDLPDEWFVLAHEEEYYRGFVENSLDPVRWRRIGWYQCFRLGGIMTAVRVGWQERAYVLWAGLLLSCGYRSFEHEFGINTNSLMRAALNESEAACAFDEKLRSICNDPVRLKKSLNFPTDQESGSII